MSASTSSRRGGKGGKHRRHVAYKSDHGIQPAQANSDINVTPLVDVCLVLLIIFMVVTPMLGRGVAVQLPTLSTATMHKEGDQVFVSVNDDGAWVETDMYTEKEPFLARLDEDLKIASGKALANDYKGPILFVKGDKGTQWGRVKTVMEWITGSNVQMQDVALVVEVANQSGPAT
ncbi:biopolymer transporter ExbD [Nannocystis sp. ILAH1]|uniref:ExbD/TolR family protein n=1 Tax=unclassified Nannocystis TaxID=2627009 RepID=UPI0022700B13|nr:MULTISPECIES: biopolymer transporter ExbD [unclassified Nannocystis]MCY0993227.1 biopolymer transporter ExbD [Nannocystis sp. ILAH1]MCY1063340.1 biopolymer transporter ExbD [Nannocystis sp. RBIL2]